MDKAGLVELFKEKLHPELVRQIQTHLPDDFALADNQNQNQGGLEELATMKPEVLRSLGVGLGAAKGDEVMDNQNQNQSKIDDLMKMKPAVLQNIRSVLFDHGNEAMDNQNQNQGGATLMSEKNFGKPE